MEAASISQAEKNAAIKAEKAAEADFQSEQSAVNKTGLKNPTVVGQSGLTPDPELEPAKIGTWKDAINTKNTEKYEAGSAEKKEEKRDKSKRAPILSLAQLRDEKLIEGVAATTAEVKQVKELEAKILEEGAKLVRTGENK